MLPPPPPPKKQVGVYIRFQATEHERLARIAAYRQLSLPALLHYVLVNSVLPKLEKEVEKEQQAASSADQNHDWLNEFT